jgi:hypothetical protein
VPFRRACPSPYAPERPSIGARPPPSPGRGAEGGGLVSAYTPAFKRIGAWRHCAPYPIEVVEILGCCPHRAGGTPQATHPSTKEPPSLFFSFRKR